MYKIIGGDQKEYGPVTADELRQWIAEGRLSSQSRAKLEDAGEWKPLAAFGEFEAALQAQASQFPGAAPSAPPRDATAWTEQLQSRPPELNVGKCLSRSWDLLSANVGLIFGSTALVWLVGLLQFVPVVSLGYFVVHGVLFGGLCLVFLKRIRGEPSAASVAFSGFNLAFAQLALAGIVVSFLCWIGLMFCFVPGIYLAVAWVFAVPLVADKRLEFWSAMKLSRTLASRVWFRLFGLILVAFFPAIVVALFAEVKISNLMVPFINDIFIPFIKELIALRSPNPDAIREAATNLAAQIAPYRLLINCAFFANLPFGLGALMYAYEDLFGARRAPDA
jgi:hypothetical protein